jgi:hypothetical protein
VEDARRGTLPLGPPKRAPAPPKRTARATVSSQVGGRGGRCWLSVSFVS